MYSLIVESVPLNTPCLYRCHTVPRGQTSCSSHAECQLPNTDCGYVDSYLQPSFGYVPCSSCTTQAQCVVGASGMGSCTCMLKPITTQTCQSLASRVSVNPTQLCLASLGATATTSSSYSAVWSSLASAPCASLNQAQAWCMTVWLSATTSAQLVVGLSLLHGRRLLGLPGPLAVNMSEWRRAREPCRSLMLSPNLTSVLDGLVALECERWRDVGFVAIGKFNLTGMEPVDFTSWQALAEASLRAPKSWIHIAAFMLQQSDWAQPFLMLGRRWASKLNFTLTWPNATAAPESIWPPHLMPWDKAPGQQVPRRNHSSPHSRRLLQTWKDKVQAVQSYTQQIVSGQQATLTPDLAANWATGPFFWPPDYSIEASNKCLLASLALNLTLPVLQSTIDFYSGTRRPAVMATTFVESLPPIYLNRSAEPSPIAPWAADTWTRNIFAYVTNFILSTTGFGSGTITDLVQGGKLQALATAVVTCDFDAAQHCTKATVPIGWAVVVVTSGLMLLGMALKVVGLPGSDLVLILLWWPLVMMWAYGYGPRCYPLVPTCFADDMATSLETWLQPSIAWPDDLQRWPGCVDGRSPPNPNLLATATPGTSSCFLDCKEAPFNFKTWEDNLAWALCRVGPCTPLADWIDSMWQPLVSESPWWGLGRLRDAIRVKASIDSSAQWVCWGLTLVNVVPILLLAVGVVALLLMAAAVPFILAQWALSTLVSVILFTHA